MIKLTIDRAARVLLSGSLVLLGTALPLQAQESASGRIIGRVLGAENARPISSAQVYLEDGSRGALTDLDGRYVLRDVPSGTHTVVVQMLGYGTKSVTDVIVNAGEIVSLDVTMEQQAIEVEGITVSATAEQGSTAALLNQRRSAEALVEAIGSAEISRRPDSDAADVAQRMTGVTVTDGKYVFVRGLGERYSQTTLNGSSLPSPEPEKSVVPLDLFPSGFLESLETQKSYTPDMPADFSGGTVKINTRDFPNRFSVKFGVSTSFNTMSQFADGFLHYGGGDLDFLGVDDGTRDQPDVLSRLMGGIRSGERLPADDAQRIEIGEALRDVPLAFGPAAGSTPLNRSFDVSMGGSAPVLDDGEIGYLIAGTYTDKYTIRNDEVERKWRTSAFNPETADLSTPNVDYAFDRGTRNITWGSIGNLTFKPTPTQKISLRTTVNLNTDDEARRFVGNNDEDIGGQIRSERARFVRRLMLWGQLTGEHALFGDHRLDWRLTGARADRYEPMLRETIYLEDQGTFRLLDFTESGRYFFSELVDDDLSAALDYRVPFEIAGREWAVQVGGAYRTRDRSFGARRLNWDFLGNTIESLDEALGAAEIVAGAPGLGEFSIDEVVEPGDVYAADDERLAGYLMLDVPVTGKLQAVLGARVEDYTLNLASRGETLNEVAQTDVAPSLNLIYSITDDVKVRGAVSRTLDRPEFRELAPFQFTEATSLRQLFGNPNLTSAEITSSDLRIDWFPGPSEMISVGFFHKTIDEPIEQVFIAAASSAYSFQNADEATVTGVEIDVQLHLDRVAEALQDFSFQGNYSWIDSEVSVREGGIYQPTNLSRPLEGQASYVLNLGLNYTAGTSGLEAGVFFNRFGERVTAAGGSGIPDIYEAPRNDLDATLAFPLPAGVRAKIKGSNLLDAEYLFTQSANGFTRTQRAYSVGRTISVGLSWEL